MFDPQNVWPHKFVDPPKKIGGGGVLKKKIPINFLGISGNSKAGGVPRICFQPKSYFFLWVKTPCKISKPYDNPLWEKSNAGREKKEETTPVIVDT